MGGKSALIFGASGVTGWAFVNEMLNDYPKKRVWGKVHALTNRPLKQEDSLWPNDPRLNIVSGIDLLSNQEELEKTMKDKIKDIDKVTHVYYLAYKAGKDVQKEFEDAVNMWRRSTTAMDHLSPVLEFVVLQLGAKMYGCHLLEDHPTDYIHVPLREGLPRLKDPYHDLLFYHPQIVRNAVVQTSIFLVSKSISADVTTLTLLPRIVRHVRPGMDSETACTGFEFPPYS